jgi:prevent-host-death family protein
MRIVFDILASNYIYFEIYTWRCFMKTATAKELRDRASSILESVIKGNEVIITMRGKSIAVLKPLGKGRYNLTP